MAKGKMVLTVDANQDVRRFVRSVLRPLGYRVETVPDGVEALLKLAQGPVDLILLDCMMPRTNSLLFCKALEDRNLAKGVPVVLLTSSEDEVADELKEHTRVVDSLPKPVKAGVLRQVVEKHLAVVDTPDEEAKESEVVDQQGFENLGDFKEFNEFEEFEEFEESGQFDGTAAFQTPPQPDASVSMDQLVTALRDMVQKAVAAGLASRLDEIAFASSRKEMLDIIEETVVGVVDDDFLVKLIERIRFSS